MIGTKEAYKMLGNYIFEMRTKKNLRQIDVANPLGFSNQFYGRIEKGAVPIPQDALVKLIVLLELDRAVIDRIMRAAAVALIDELYSEAEQQLESKKKRLKPVAR